MLTRIFPKQVDNAYRGNRMAIVLLVPLVLLRAVIGFNSIFFSRAVATTADGIAVDHFDPAGQAIVLTLFALAGLALLLLALIGTVVLIRYRAMIPLMYLLLLLQELGSKAIGQMHPTGQTGGGASLFVLGMIAATVVGFILSLIHRREETPA